MSTRKQHDWTMRPATRADIQPICELARAHSLALNGVAVDAQRDIEHTWDHPAFSLETDTRVAVLPDGHVIGYALVQDTNAPHVRVGGSLRVHPEAKDQGIETALLDWIEQRSREAVAKAPANARVILTHGIRDEDLDMRNLLEARGFHVSRHFWRMEIDLSADIPTPAWPADVTARPFVLSEDLEAIVRAHQSAFSDHWGHVAMPYEQELEQWKTWIRNDPEFDESLTYLVSTDDEVVAYASCDLRHSEDPTMGYVGILGVTRPWRRKGIALALLQHVFRDFQNRGQRRVCLGVDSASLTGAVGLYEAAGMKTTRTTTVFEKELRSGTDLSLKCLENENVHPEA